LGAIAAQDFTAQAHIQPPVIPAKSPAWGDYLRFAASGAQRFTLFDLGEKSCARRLMALKKR
jgi:hypothetical protein